MWLTDQPVTRAQNDHSGPAASTASPIVNSHLRRIFCASATGADYALLSPSIRHVGYRAPQRRASVLNDQGREGPPSTSYRHPTHDPRRTSSRQKRTFSPKMAIRKIYGVGGGYLSGQTGIAERSASALVTAAPTRRYVREQSFQSGLSEARRTVSSVVPIIFWKFVAKVSSSKLLPW